MSARGKIVPLQIQLLGTFAVRRGEADLSAPLSANARRLLACLLLGARPAARVALVGRLWPDLPEASARRALRQAIWQVNASIPGLVRRSRLRGGWPARTLCAKARIAK